jgi:hypothetical protein
MFREAEPEIAVFRCYELRSVAADFGCGRAPHHHRRMRQRRTGFQTEEALFDGVVRLFVLQYSDRAAIRVDAFNL